mmetsp:Transcript_9453/g.38824  ORF Transcript_9453/g.38824 Transcript_9453/m.38824 type:complete len:246 (-) Transcript_9453:412-1149(-)
MFLLVASPAARLVARHLGAVRAQLFLDHRQHRQPELMLDALRLTGAVHQRKLASHVRLEVLNLPLRKVLHDVDRLQVEVVVQPRRQLLGEHVKGLGAPLGYAYLRAHARLLRVELVLLLLPAREFKHGALAVELFHLGVVLSLLARAVLAPAFDLFDLLEACLVAAALGVERELIANVLAGIDVRRYLLAPNEALGQVGVTEGIVFIRVAGDRVHTQRARKLARAALRIRRCVQLRVLRRRRRRA